MALREEFERAVLIELQREHASLCRDQKIDLKPITIQLIDSDSKWGSYDPQTSTINIARKLVLKYDWFHVVAVFRHEMAHQYVHEILQVGQRDETAHGFGFEKACERLCVPQDYARYGVDLQSFDLDWRTRVRDESSEKILERVRKLLALSGSTNEHEAVLAMSRVRELYAKYNIEKLTSGHKSEFVHLVINTRKKRVPSWQQRLFFVLSEIAYVRVISYQQFSIETQEYHKAYELIGTRENVLMAEYVYTFLMRQVDLLIANYLVEYPIPRSRPERDAFRMGIVVGFHAKLQAIERETTIRSPETSQLKTAITLFKKDPHIDAYYRRQFPRVVSKRIGQQNEDDENYGSGLLAGYSLNLNRPISENQGNKGGLLE